MSGTERCGHAKDKSGNLTLEELLVGFDSIEYFSNLLKAMDISRDDLKVVFNILDKDAPLLRNVSGYWCAQRLRAVWLG